MRSFVPWGLNECSLAIHCQEKVPLKNRPVGYGVSAAPRLVFTHNNRVSIASRSYRSLRDGSRFVCIPGNELLGYDHLVPPGHTP